MFEQLRIKSAVRQSVTLGLVLISLLVVLFVINFLKLSNDVDERLTELILKDDFSIFPGLGVDKTAVIRDSVSYLIVDGQVVDTTAANFYDQDTVDTIVVNLANQVGSRGRVRINSYYIAYHTQMIPKGVIVHIYDYTKEGESLINLAIIVMIIGALGMIAIVIFCFRSADKSVIPIESAFHKQQDLIANASHELKTPLTIINTNLSILTASVEEIPTEHRKWVEGIQSQVVRMSDLITEMLDLAKMDAMQEEQPFSELSLSELAEAVMLESEVLAFENNITMSAEIEPNVKMNGVQHNIEKLFYILLENAVKYADAEGQIKLSVYTERKKSVIKVRNTGKGIPKEHIPKLFDRFYRTDESRNSGQSSGSFGLGLSIAKAIVDANKGMIGVESVEDEYTEFIVIFKQV